MKKGMAKALETAIKDPDELHPAPVGKVKRIFANRARRRIFTILTYHPCLSISKIAEELEISGNSVLWHLEKLVASGFVIERRRGRRRLFWAEGLIDEADIDTFFILANETSRNIVQLVLESPGIFQKEVTDKLGLSHQGISSQARQLKGEGIIDTVSEGVHIRYYPTKYLSDRSKENYERAKAFRSFMIDRLDILGEAPNIVKSSQKVVMLEIGPKSDRSVLEIGLDPFITALANE